MRGLAEWTAARLVAISHTSRGQWVLRLSAVLIGALGVGLADRWAPQFFAPLLLGLAILALASCLAFPDSSAALGFIVLLAIWWAIGGGRAPLWQAAALALVIAAVNLLLAWASSGPAHAVVGQRLALRMSRLALGYLVAVFIGLGLLWAVTLVPSAIVPRGLGWILLAGAVIVVLGSLVLRDDA